MGKVKDRMVKLTGEGADAQYLTWNQFCFYVNGLRCLAKLGWIDRA